MDGRKKTASEEFNHETCRWHESRIEKMESRVDAIEKRWQTDITELRGGMSDLKAQGSLVRGIAIGIATALTTAGTLVGILAAIGKL